MIRAIRAPVTNYTVVGKEDLRSPPPMNLSKKFLDDLKERLLKEKQELEEELKSFAEEDLNVKGNYKTIFPDYGKSLGSQEENADEVEEYYDSLPVEHTLEARLKEVNDALKRITKKSFGMCENCQKPIAKERLEASLTARTCVECNAGG